MSGKITMKDSFGEITTPVSYGAAVNPGPLPPGEVRRLDPFDDVLVEINKLHVDKSLQYGTNEDPYANIRRSEEFGLKPWVYCAVECGNCLKRLENIAKGRNVEDPINAFNDLATWAILSRLFFEKRV